MSASPEISKVAASNSPVNVTFLKLAISLLLSTTTTFEAATVPAVTPSLTFSSAAVAVIEVPPICNVVALTSPEEPYITALEFTIVPALEPSTKFNSAAVEDTVVLAIESASVSSVPSISTSPDISKLVASISPEALKVTPSALPTLNIIWSSVLNFI